MAIIVNRLSNTIKAHPTFDFSKLISKSKGYPAPLGFSNTYYYGYARVALLDGLRLLSIKAGDNVLIPSYICEDVLEPFNYLGIATKYYNVDEKLNPIIYEIENSIDSKTKAVLAVNYFGFPTSVLEIANICKNKSLYFIEDNAHGLFSKCHNGVLGSFGDISIFSMRKTIGAPNGAALVINNSVLNNYERNKSTIGISGIRYLIASLNQSIEDNIRINPIKAIKGIVKYESLKTYSCHVNSKRNIQYYFEKYSKITEYVIKRVDVDKCISTRRRGYVYWIEHVTEGDPLYGKLPDGVVPYVFPMRIRNRDGFIQRLIRKADVYLWDEMNAEIFPWPSLPKNLGKVPSYYNEIVCLPVWKNIHK